MNNDIWNEKCIISPSLICLDMLNVEEQIRELEMCGIGMIHVDILDGHFSPSMPLGFEIVRQLRSVTDLAFECHVMAEKPEFFINELLDIGVQQITFHVETADHADGLINRIHASGVRAGLALKPATSLSVLDFELEKCDSVLLMQINPGYASDKAESRACFMDRKIRELREMINNRKPDAKIIIDGRVSAENIREYGRGIADIFVGGTTCISKGDIVGSVKRVMDIRSSLLND